MQIQFRLFLRGSVYYSEDCRTGRQTSLKTKDENEARQLVQARNSAANHPAFNRAMARSFLSVSDGLLETRTWQDVMNRFCDRENPATKARHERFIKSKPMVYLRGIKLLETNSDDFFHAIKIGTKSTINFLQTLHNDAFGVGWILAPIVHPKKWPKKSKGKRKAISEEQHKTLVASFKSEEWKRYLETLWHIGASQTDCANLQASNIDWEKMVLTYDRQKLKGRELPPASMAIGKSLGELLRKLPKEGPLFPHITTMNDRSRSCLMWKRSKRLNFEKGISLHSYRYSWAERAKKAGLSMRYAMAALGHNSKAVAETYAKGSHVICPSIEEDVKGN